MVEEEDPAGVVPVADEALLLLAHPGVEDGVGGEADVKGSEQGGEQERESQTHRGCDSQC